MSDSPPVVELRRSVSLLATEWWVFIGILASYLLFGAWVVGTGIALTVAVPSLARTTVTTVGATPVTGRTAFALIAWVVAPAAVAAWLLDRQLSNPSGNLIKRYRFDHPGVLPAPPGVLALVFAVAAIALGPLVPVVALGAVAGIHLLVRTVAFGRRVFSFSPPRLFRAFSLLSGAALAAAWLVHAPGLPDSAGRQVGRAGVGSVVDTATAIAGTTPATALGVLVAVPALLSGLYLGVQAAVAHRVRSRAPLPNPEPKGARRYPIMPPVPDSERPGVTVPDRSETPDDQSPTDEADEPAEADEPVDGDEPTEVDKPAAEESDDGKSDTRVFTADEPVPDEKAVTKLADEAETTDDDEDWIDDTSVFSPERGSASSDECDSCGKELPTDSSVTFCPDCGQKI